MIEKKRYRTDDSVELSFRKFMKLIELIGGLLVVTILTVSLISGIIITSQSNSETIGPVFLLLMFGAIVSVIIWAVAKLIVLILTYITDMHYYSRSQMETTLGAAGIELEDMKPKEWVCPNCGKFYVEDIAFCTECGTKRS